MHLTHTALPHQGAIVAIENAALKVYGLQYHPEVRKRSALPLLKLSALLVSESAFRSPAIHRLPPLPMSGAVRHCQMLIPRADCSTAPQVTHTERGMHTLRHFLTTIAGVTPDWSMENVLEEQLELIRAKAR